MVFYSQIEEKWGKLLKMEKIEFLIIFDGSRVFLSQSLLSKFSKFKCHCFPAFPQLYNLLIISSTWPPPPLCICQERERAPAGMKPSLSPFGGNG